MLLFPILFGLSINTKAQEVPTSHLSMQQAVDSALKNNYELQSAQLRIEHASKEKGLAWDMNPASLSYQQGQINTTEKDYYLEVNQNFGSIATHIANYRQAKQQVALQQIKYSIQRKKVTAETKSAYQFWQYLYTVSVLREKETNMYDRLAEIADLRYKAGDIALLEKSMAFTKASEIRGSYLNSLDDLVIAENKLHQLMMTDNRYTPDTLEPELYRVEKSSDTSSYHGSLLISYYNTHYLLTRTHEAIVKTQYFPELQAGFFTQEIANENGLSGWQVGVSVPLYIPANQAKIKQAKINSEIAQNDLEYQQIKISNDIETLLYELNKYFRQIRHFQQVALPQAEILLNTADSQLNAEEIDFTRFVQSVSLAFSIQLQYYEAINLYNQTALQLEIYGE